MRWPWLATIFTMLFTVCGIAPAQHLWWDLEKQRDATCLYGEIAVLATHTSIYYCGANWHPGEPAGGYCGIQHNGPKERRTIFSIWDTSPQLHPQVTEADAGTIFNRFGNEGSGAHTHMLWPWKEGETFAFFVRKEPGSKPETTDARYYVYDRAAKRWLHSATITSPDGGKKSVATFAGGLNSFLENFSGKDRAVPKLALYRLWLGTSTDDMKCLARASGDGTWGQLADAYFLAEGDKEELNAVFARLEKQYGKPVLGEKGKKLDPISDKPVPPEVIKELKALPRAPKVTGQRARGEDKEPAVRILLIDDSLSDQGEIAAVLLAAGHEVVAASSTREAIQAITDDCVNLVLVDATIPRFSDLHFLELLREDLKWTDLPAIVLADEEGLSRLASLRHLRLSLCLAKTASVIAQLPALIHEAIRSDTGEG